VAEFSLRHPHGNDRCSLQVAGQIDLACAGKLAALGRVGIESDARLLSIDLGEVSFLDSTGIGALVQIRNAARARNKQLVLTRPSRQVSRVLEMTGLESVFAIQDA
jgi:anti-sigma B factor antagonist